MNRRDLIKSGIGMAVTACSREKGNAEEREAMKDNRPNILLLMADQVNASALSCYGGPVPTPNLERIANQGLSFDNATCTVPFCSPSRASLVTGLYAHAHGIVYNCNRIDYPTHARPNSAVMEGINSDDVTTEKLLNGVGYQTYHYGKWHLSDEEGLPYYTDQYRECIEYPEEMASTFRAVEALPRRNWMEWYNWSLPVDVAPVYREAGENIPNKWKDLPREDQQHEDFIIKAGRLKLPVKATFESRVADQTIERLYHLSPGPFMLTCSMMWPHDPNVVPSPYYEEFDPQKIELPANRNYLEARFEQNVSRRIVRDTGGQDGPGIRELLRIYYGTIRLVDDQIGRVLDALEASGHSKNTIVIFCADHGDMAGGHGMFWKSTSSFYEEVTRVPLIISYPGHIKPGRTQMAASLVDIMPTLLDLAGHPIPKHAQGDSLAPYLLNSRDQNAAPAYRFSERVNANHLFTRSVVPGTAASFMIRGKGWKYILYPDGGDYLYDLTDDPGETKNLTNEAKFKDQKIVLIQELNAWLDRTGFRKTKS